MPAKNNTKTLPGALALLAESKEFTAVLDIDSLPAEEQETARLINAVLNDRDEYRNKEIERSLSALNSMCNNLDASILVTRAETGEIIYANDRLKKLFSLDNDCYGKRCYEHLFGNTERCDYCPYEKIKDHHGKDYQWIMYNSPNGSVYRMSAMLIDWPGEAKAHLEFGVEITEEMRHEKMLMSILNGMTALITLVDPDTYKILFINDSIRRYFGIKSDGIGEVCYELLQGRDAPCVSCPHQELLESPEEVIVWEHMESINNNILHKTASMIDWVGGKKAHLEYAIDITETKNLRKNVLELESEVEKIFYDPLTGIYSRRFFEETIERLINSLSRSTGVLSIMMVDIDYFKKYNDTYGHIKGDDCLKVVAETLRKCTMRKDDFVARYGGEEFVVILPNTKERGARSIADNMLREVRSRNIPHENSDAADCVTVSIGVVTGQVLHTQSRDDYLKRADEMLYISKGSGRNRYTFAKL